MAYLSLDSCFACTLLHFFGLPWLPQIESRVLCHLTLFEQKLYDLGELHFQTCPKQFVFAVRYERMKYSCHNLTFSAFSSSARCGFCVCITSLVDRFDSSTLEFDRVFPSRIPLYIPTTSKRGTCVLSKFNSSWSSGRAAELWV